MGAPSVVKTGTALRFLFAAVVLVCLVQDAVAVDVDFTTTLSVGRSALARRLHAKRRLYASTKVDWGMVKNKAKRLMDTLNGAKSRLEQWKDRKEKFDKVKTIIEHQIALAQTVWAASQTGDARKVAEAFKALLDAFSDLPLVGELIEKYADAMELLIQATDSIRDRLRMEDVADAQIDGGRIKNGDSWPGRNKLLCATEFICSNGDSFTDTQGGNRCRSVGGWPTYDKEMLDYIESKAKILYYITGEFPGGNISRNRPEYAHMVDVWMRKDGKNGFGKNWKAVLAVAYPLGNKEYKFGCYTHCCQAMGRIGS